MEHCLLFGARGHLAQTKLIPNFKRQDVTYTSISRKQKVDLREHYNNKNVICFMAIPTGRIMDHVEKYEDDFLRMKPTFVLEKLTFCAAAYAGFAFTHRPAGLRTFPGLQGGLPVGGLRQRPSIRTFPGLQGFCCIIY